VQIAAPARLAEHSYFTAAKPVVRLHIGLEDVRDLIDDLDQAFQRSQQVQALARQA
jgi:cystathionine beta-lyase